MTVLKDAERVGRLDRIGITERVGRLEGIGKDGTSCLWCRH